ncbi:replicative DNA helicase [compost metagenome]
MVEAGVLTDITTEKVIFSRLFKTDEGVYSKKQEVINKISLSDAFKNEYHIFYLLAKEHTKINPTKQFIELYLRTNRATFLKNRNIDLSGYSSADIEPFAEFVNNCLVLFEECVKTQVSDNDFYMHLEMHKMQYINMRSITVLQESTEILTEGIVRRNKPYKGYSDMRTYLKTGFLELDNLMENNSRKGLISYGDDDDMDDDAEVGLERVTTYGVEALDAALGGIYAGDMVSLLAPAKGCKSRFATHVLHNAIVNHGANVIMWSIENGHKGWESLIRARHFNWLYNSKQVDVTKQKFIDNDMIRKKELTGELRELELTSWTDLRHNRDYGRFHCIDEDFDVDTFIPILEDAITKTGAKLICVDYLQLIGGGEGKSTSKNERVGEAYIKLLQFLKRKKVAAILPAQLKQTVVGDLNKVKPEDLINTELRNAAGESYEVIKTPDVNLALYGTVEDIRNGSMMLLGIPSRNSAPFEPIDLYVDAGTCTFASIKKEE